MPTSSNMISGRTGRASDTVHCFLSDTTDLRNLIDCVCNVLLGTYQNSGRRHLIEILGADQGAEFVSNGTRNIAQDSEICFCPALPNRIRAECGSLTDRILGCKPPENLPVDRIGGGEGLHILQ